MDENEKVYRDPKTGVLYPVKPMPSNDEKRSLKEGTYYQNGEFVYPFVGYHSSYLYLRSQMSGCIAIVGGRLFFQDWKTDEERLRHSVRYVVEKSRIDELERKYVQRDFAGILQDYMDAYSSGHNLAAKIRRRTRNSGDYYQPPLSDEDYPLDRISKLLVRSQKIVSSERRNQMDKEYGFDNLVSTMNGGTEHMSIMKFLDWTYLLNWSWEFSVFDISDDILYPIGGEIKVTNTDDKWKQIYIPQSKDVFKVPLVRTVKGKVYDESKPYQFEDPFKRLIKLALDKKNVPTSYYRNRGTTPHLINNMKSALKNGNVDENGVASTTGQKMTSRYFHIWCELLDMGFRFTVRSENGVYYTITGMDIDRIETNYVPENDEIIDEEENYDD